MNLILIRHAKTEVLESKNPALWHLSEDGIKESLILSQNELIKTTEVIYSCFQTKTLETSLLLSRNNYIPILVDNDLNESSSISNGYFSEYSKTLKNYFSGNLERINEGETIVESQYRFNNCIEKIVLKHSNANSITIVSHRSMLSFFSSQYTEESADKLYEKIDYLDFAVFNLEEKKFEKLYGN